jgi:type II secretion system protein N
MFYRLPPKRRRQLFIIGFCLYGVLAVLFFVYLTLPVEAIGRFLLAKAAEQAGVHITAGGFKRSAPLGFDSQDVTMTDLGGSQVFMTSSRVSVAVVPSSLLSRTKLVSIRLPIYGGSAEGRLGIGSSGPLPRYDLDAVFQDIRLQEFPLLQSILASLPNLRAGRDHGMIRGVGRVEVHYGWDADQPAMGSGQISIEIQDLKAEKMTVLNFPASDLSFPKVVAKLTLKDGIATLNELTGSGLEMDVSGNGLVQLRQPLTSSLLNLTMKLALKNKVGLPDSLVLLKSLVGENRPIEVSITGTIGRPFINTRGLSLSPISHVSLGPPPLASPTPASPPVRQAGPEGP